VLGVPPAQASQRVHFVECFTTAMSGISHLLHRNIDGKLFLRLVVPGMIGGFAGAYLLSSLDASVVKPFVLLYLSAIGIYLLVRGVMYPPRSGSQAGRAARPVRRVPRRRRAAAAGGPVVTSNLLIQGADPRKVVGTVNSAEFFLTVTVSATFIYHIGATQLVGATLGLLIGGLLAARSARGRPSTSRPSRC
jgi:uncharacterized membrane protein YfcA